MVKYRVEFAIHRRLRIRKLVSNSLFALCFCAFSTSYPLCSKKGRAVILTSDLISETPYPAAILSTYESNNDASALPCRS